MPKTKKHYKKRRTIRKRKTIRGGSPTFTEGLRRKTKTITMRNAIPERRRTITPNDRNRFNRSNRTYVPAETNQDLRFIATPPKLTTRDMIKSPPKFRDNGFMVDNKFGPNEQGYYLGPSVIRGEKGIPHGKDGLIKYSSGHLYVGDFNKGKREGTGSFIVKDGPTYEGEWKDDKFVPFTEWKSQNK
jgi:hypothetical protein